MAVGGVNVAVDFADFEAHIQPVDCTDWWWREGRHIDAATEILTQI